MLTKYFGILALLLLINPASIFLFLLFTVLVYGYRLIVIFLAKLLRPDLGVCMSGITNCQFVNDWFTKTSPRSTLVLKYYCKNVRTRKCTEEQVLRRWIAAKQNDTGKPLYPQFIQYPYRWLGFTFWKNDENFDIRNHVLAHSVGETGDDDLNKLTKKLLNEPYHRNRSPWEIHLVENFKSTKFHEKISSVIVLKFHHCLADGYSILSALVEGINETPMSGWELPNIRRPQKTLAQQVYFVVTFLFVFCYELFGVFKYAFEYSPWKVVDSVKKWHMVCSQSELIPMQNVKDIKTKCGVSFTSVLISVISAGISKMNSRHLDNDENGQTLCLSMLPLGLGNRKDRLTNQMTAAIFPLATGSSHTNSVERVKSCNELLEKTRNSLIPYAFSIYVSVIGSLFSKAASFLGKNRFISVGLTNFPILPPNRKEVGLENIVFGDFIVGGVEGVCGLFFTVGTCAPYMRIGVSAEQAVLSQEEADYLVKFIEHEIKALHDVFTCSDVNTSMESNNGTRLLQL